MKQRDNLVRELVNLVFMIGGYIALVGWWINSLPTMAVGFYVMSGIVAVGILATIMLVILQLTKRLLT